MDYWSVPDDVESLEQLVNSFEDYWSLKWRESVLWPREPFTYHACWEGFLAVRLTDLQITLELPEFVRQVRQEPNNKVFFIMVG
ncbi:hypothetical protein [Desulfurispora thermophila]|uniref:hypothetical protein n=1 Tax=Desulfurispora thermophila TaxID=265470 RepID=UPI00036C2B6C|nr:hypothetical protein [Desulfurispora thermophila]